MLKKSLSMLCLCALLLSLGGAAFAADVELSQLNYDDYFSARDLSGSWKADEAVSLALDGSLTISEEGVYLLSGTLADGCITVNAPKEAKVQLVLNGVSVTSSVGPCLLVESAGKVFVTLAEGTENSLSSAAFAAGAEEDGAVYARDDIVFNGKGKLVVRSAAHGIVGKDDVKFGGGEYDITAAGRGISGKDSVRIFDGSFTIDCGKDPIRSKSSEADRGYVLILGGQFYLNGNQAD